MAQIIFDAILNDQMSAALEAIAEKFGTLNDAVDAAAKNFGDGMKQMMDATVSFADSGLPRITDGVEAVAEKVGLFTDETAVNYTQSLKAMTDSTTQFLNSTGADSTALQGETDLVDNLAKSFYTLSDNKNLASIAEEDMATATAGTSAALNTEAATAGTAAAALTAEADAGAANQPNRESGYGAIMGATALLGMAGAAAKLGESLIASGIQSQAALTEVTSLADQNASHVGTYEQGLQQIAMDTGQSLVSLAGGLYDITSVGFQSADALKILQQAAEAAAVGGTDLHTVTNGLTSIMIAFNLNANQSSQALNTLMIGVRDGKAHFQDFSRAIGLVSDTAKNAGFSLNEASAALAAMSAVYPTVRQAGQNLRNLMTDISTNAVEVADKAKKMGIGFDLAKFSSMDFYDRLVYLKDITRGNSDELKKLLGGVTGYNAYLAIMASGASRYTTALNDMNGKVNVLDQAFTLYKQSIQAKIEELTATVGVFAARLTLLVAPAITTGLNLAKDIFTALANVIENHGQAMTLIITTLAFLIAGTLVGAIVALGEAMKIWIGPALEDAAPFMIIAAAIGVFIGYLISAYEHSKPFHDAVNQLGTALGQLWAALKPVRDEISHLITEALKPLADMLLGASTGVGKTHDKIQQIQSPIDVLTVIIQGLTMHIKQFTDFLNGVGQKASDVVTPLHNMGRSLGGVRDFLQTFAGPASAVQQATQKLADIFEKAQAPIQGVGSVVNPMGRSLHGATQSIQALKVQTDPAVETVRRFWDVIKGLLGPLLMIIGPLLGIGGAAALFGTNLLNGKAMATGFTGVVKDMGPVAKNVFGALAEFGNDAIRAIRLLFNGGSPMALLFGKIMDKLGPIIENVATKIGDFFIGFEKNKGFFEQLLDNWGPKLVQFFLDLGGNITDLIGIASSVTVVILLILGAVVGTIKQFQYWYATSSQFRAMLAGFGDDLKGLWTTLQAQFLPIWQQLQATFKTQIMPTLMQLKTLWDDIQPALMLVGAIVIAVLVVAFGILINVIKAVISSIGPFVTGLITFLGGAFQVVAGIIQVFVGVIGGVFTLIYDLIFAHQKLGHDALEIWNNLKNGVVNIVKGLGAMVSGLWTGLVGTVWTLVSTFVTGIIGWFAHLFDKLVGHSIVTDLVKMIIFWFNFLFITVPNMVAAGILHLIELFVMLGKEVIAAILYMEEMVIEGIEIFVKNILQMILDLETMVIEYILAMVNRGIALFNYLTELVIVTIERFVIHVLTMINNLVSMAIAFFVGLSVKIPAAIITMVNNVLNAAVYLEIDFLYHISLMIQIAINYFGGLVTSIVNYALALKNNVVGHIMLLKAEVEYYIALLVHNFERFFSDLPGNLSTTITNAMTGIFGILNGKLQDALTWGANFIGNLVKGITDHIGDVTKAATNVGNTIARILGHHSPAQEGPLSDDDEWMGNMMGMMADGITAHTPRLQSAATSAAFAIKNGISSGSGALAVGAAGGGVASGAILAGGGAYGGAQQVTVHLNLNGGLGAGLQLLNPSDRQTFVKQISQELANQTNLQGRPSNGYSGN